MNQSESKDIAVVNVLFDEDNPDDTYDGIRLYINNEHKVFNSYGDALGDLCEALTHILEYETEYDVYSGSSVDQYFFFHDNYQYGEHHAD